MDNLFYWHCRTPSGRVWVRLWFRKKGEYARGMVALEKQKKDLTTQCITLQNRTPENDRGLQTDLTAITDRLDASRMLNPQCVLPESGDTSNANAARGTKYAGRNGLSTQWLRQYAAKAEEYRTKVIWFQKACSGSIHYQ